VSLVALAAGPGACELCATELGERACALVIRHPRGGAVRFAVCAPCAAAVRRLAASAGGRARFSIGDAAPRPRAQAGSASHPWRRPAAPTRPAPELVHECTYQVFDADGVPYLIRAYGEAR